MRALVNPVQTYAWGSYTAIARLQGRPSPAQQPEAELWMGAHPSAPSLVVGPAGDTPAGRIPLTEVIAADPAGVLGAATHRRFGARLPYLLKVLAAERPLSLQVHPDADQARNGYANDERAAVSVGPAQRNYVDPYHKPELLVALTEFEALCGFRDPEQSAGALAALRVAALAPVVSALRSGPEGERLRRAVQLLLGWPDGERADLVKAVAERAREAGLALPASLAQTYPTDPGVVLALLLNHVRLSPNEAIFMPAGNLHAYLRGVGVEVMASSDNVLRCGLTPKHVDVAESTRILRYAVLADPVVRPVPAGPGLLSWSTPAAEFALVRAEAEAETGPVSLPGAGPRILICVRGDAGLRAGGASLDLAQGEAAFLTAAEPAAQVSGGAAVVFQAAPAA